MTRLRRLVSIALASVLTLSTTLALAEPHRWPAPAGDPPKAALDEAQARFIAGNRAVEQGKWSDALAEFAKSYALSGVGAALFNVATTLRALGRHVEARDAFEQLLEKHPKLDPAIRKQAEEMLAEEKARVASLVIADLPSKKDDLRIVLDGKSKSDDGARPLALEVDPGHHTLRVEESKSKPYTWEGSFTDGEKKTVSVKLEPAPVAAQPKPAESGGGVLSSPVFWTVVSVVVIGGAITGGYFYHQSKQLQPESPNVVKL